MSNKIDENELAGLFERSTMHSKDGDMKFSAEETQRFRKAFDDPEFRKLFSEYLDEMQDPKHREETEMYINQLEGDNKVPEGKELIRPTAGFVAKFKKTMHNGEIDKVFLNVVHSDKITKPTKKSSPQGEHWSLPYSLGPPRMEKDKNGTNATAFDCCFHSEALAIAERSPRFRDLLVQTGMEGVKEFYKRARQNAKIEGDFHIVKGVQYKSGQVPSMLIASESRKTWEDDQDANKIPATTTTVAKANASNSDVVKDNKPIITTTVAETKKDESKAKQPTTTTTSSTAGAPAPAVKKGFLLGKSDDKKGASTAKPVEKTNSLIQEVKPSDSKMKANNNKNSNSSVNNSSPIENNNSSNSNSSTVAEPLMTSVKTTLKTNSAAVEVQPNNDKVPKYTVTHRGDISLGDFEGLKTSAPTSKGSLIYRFELPKVKAAIKVNLDVSPRLVKLSYEDIYDVSIQLKHTIDDKNGKAKFDKDTRVLTLTLPILVEAVPLPTVVDTAVSETSTDNNTETTPETENEVDNNTNKQEAVETVKTQQKPVEHNRWVQKQSNEESDKSAKLREDIKQQSIKAKEDYEKSQKAMEKVQETKKPLPVKEPVTTNVTEEFIAAKTFQGSKPGYYFGTGANGLGYYLDVNGRVKPPVTSVNKDTAKNSNNNNTSNTNTSTSANTANNNTTTTTTTTSNTSKAKIVESVGFEFRENANAISIVVQVSQIVAQSVHMEMSSTEVNVLLKKLKDGKVNNESSDDFEVYAFSLSVNLDVSVTDSRFDVSSRNMAIVLMKSQREGSNNASVKLGKYNGSLAIDDYCKRPMGSEVHGIVTANAKAVTSNTSNTSSTSNTSKKNKNSNNSDTSKKTDSQDLKVLKELSFQSSTNVFELD